MRHELNLCLMLELFDEHLTRFERSLNGDKGDCDYDAYFNPTTPFNSKKMILALKSEARNPKSETISNSQNPNFQNKKSGFYLQHRPDVLVICNFGNSDLFPPQGVLRSASIFGFRI